MTTEEREICKAIKDMASRLGLAVESWKGEHAGFGVVVTQGDCLDHNFSEFHLDEIITVERHPFKDGTAVYGLEFYPYLRNTSPSDREDPILNDKREEIFLPTDPYLLSLEPEPWQIIRDDVDPDRVFINTGKTQPPVRLDAVSPGKLESCLVEFLDRLNRTDIEWLANKIKYSGDTLEERFNNEAQSVHD